MINNKISIYCLTLIGRAKQAPNWGVQSRFRVIYIYIYMSVVSKMRRQNYVAQTRACSNRIPQETAPGHSQKIEARRRRVGEKPKTGEGGRYQTAQVGRGDRRRKKSKTGE